MLDRNSFAGLLLIGAILIGWMYWSLPSKEEVEKQKRIHDSIAFVQQTEEINMQAHPSKINAARAAVAAADTSLLKSDSIIALQKQERYGAFSDASKGENKTIVLENELIKVNIAALGG